MVYWLYPAWVLRERSGNAMVVVVAGCQSLDSKMVAHSMGLSEKSFNEWTIYRSMESVKE